MSVTDLTDLSLTEASQLLNRKEISPVELTQAHLARIQNLDERINSFITVTADTALERARSAEEDFIRGTTSQGKPLGPLHGIPITLKDLYETKGVRTTMGSKFFSEHIPDTDALVVEKLAAAGAISLGKTNMHEIALGLTNVNPHYGPCRNPWSLDRVPGGYRVPGGSSGGSGAALAAGLCLGSLGSDTGGSIRVPASLCGVVGLKPTHGRVSLRGVMPLSWNLDHAGPMARNVADVAVLLGVIAGYDPVDPCSVDIPVEDYTTQLREGLKGWRVALADDEYFDRSDPDVAQAVISAARELEQLGAYVDAVPFPGAHQAALANGLMTVSDGAAVHAERLRDRPGDFGDDVRQRLEIGAALPLGEYIQHRRTQSQMRRQFELFFDRYDLLLLPSTAVAAPPIEGPDALEQARLLTRYTAPFNLTGLPAISLPCGFTTEGLPIGLQIVSRPWAEGRILRAAFAFESATDWHTRRPLL